jgi:hypothetical protein
MTTRTRLVQLPAGAPWLNDHDRQPPDQARAWRGAATGDDSNDRVGQDLLHTWVHTLSGRPDDGWEGTK